MSCSVRFAALAGRNARLGVIAAFCIAALLATGARAMSVDEARHWLGRIGWGATPRALAEHLPLTRDAAIARALGSAVLEARTMGPAWVGEPLTPARVVRQMSDEERRAFLARSRQRAVELRAWWIEEMVSTPSPLTERMTLFWHGHFATSQAKVRQPQLLYRQNALFRRHALGNFGALLHAVAKDPAMLIYLDAVTNRKDRPNENFARELMELFTLGEGHYAEDDVREAARAFTGWSVDPGSGAFMLRRGQHDAGVKTVLGRTGHLDGEAVIDVLLAHPRTALAVVEKLWREFVSPTPDPQEVARIAAAFRNGGYEIAVALRELLSSSAFWAAENRGVLIKAPVELAVGAVTQLEVAEMDRTALAFVAASLGQNLFAPPNVKGWPGGETWINSQSLMRRKQFLDRLVRDEGIRDAGARGMRMSSSGPQPTSVAMARAHVLEALAHARFDAARWVEDIAAVPGLSPESLLLAVPAVDGAYGEATPRDAIRRLVLDPAYQLR